MARHGTKRSRPQELVPGTCTVISCRMDYLPEAEDSWEVMASSDKGFISRYALGRDYHKLIGAGWQSWLSAFEQSWPLENSEAFVDSAPVLERAIAEQAGMGWIAKNSMLINQPASGFFSAKFIPTYHYPILRPKERSTVAVAVPVQKPAQRMRSWRRLF